ncbi:unnamed protein product [Hymenolepis diminuta]|uniref:Rho-GAP domain-containing protein n=1 Tax=Hymenolepis diminuta TaxID=6216 RepID=A0A0R3SAK5_HYMDI|nr:unnamed protein product [Hymenolepis diminuta]
MTEKRKSEDREVVHQGSDIDELDSDNLSDESISIEGYLNINTDSEESQFNKDVYTPDSAIVRVGNVSVRTRPRVEKPTDSRKHRNTRELGKRKTVSEYLCESMSNQEEDDEKPRDLDVSKNDISPQQVNSFSDNAISAVSIEAEFKYMLAYETQNFNDLAAVFAEKKSISSAFGKHNFGNVFDMLIELHANQGWVVSYLKNICNNNKSQSVEDLMDKLRIESYMKKDDPNFEVISIASEELRDTSGNLLTAKQNKEPIKYAILVDLRNDPNPDRKLVSVFLFDNAFVCARQRVITLHKSFTQDLESETGSLSTDLKDQSGFVMNAKSISRYEIKWFVPLNQIQSVETTGIAFDENSLRERLKTIEKLKDNILNARQKLQDEMSRMEKESKRNKLKYPKIRRLRSLIYSLQAELVLQAPKLPLFINTTDQQSYCLLMSSEKERSAWKSAISQAKADYHPPFKYRSPTSAVKRNSTVKPLANVFRDPKRKSTSPVSLCDNMESETNDSMKNELSYIINHCKQVACLNKLGKVVLSGSALSGVLEVCVHEVTGLTENDSYYVAIEVDFYGHFELVAKTKSISNAKNPSWNQSFILELDTSQTICFTLFRQSTAIGHLELPLDIDHLDQKNESYNLTALEDATKPIILKISMVYNECSRMRGREDSKNQSNMFGLTLTEVLKQDQANLELLQRQVSSEKKFEKLKVPVLVTTCVEEIERRGLQEEGIYRISGTNTAITFLKSQFDEDTSLAVKQIGDYDINVVSGLLKLFFRDLSEPLIPNNVMMALIKASSLEDEDKKMAEFGKALKTLPRANLDTFRYLLDHLMRVCQYEARNKMTASNLSLVWAITLFQPLQIDAGSSAEIDLTSLQNARSAASQSMLQTTILSTILKYCADGNLDLSIG